MKAVHEGRRNKCDDRERQRRGCRLDILGTGPAKTNGCKYCEADHQASKNSDAMAQDDFCKREDPDEEGLQHNDTSLS